VTRPGSPAGSTDQHPEAGLEDTDNLPSAGVIAGEIVEDLQAALTELTELAESPQRIGVGIED
jgi:hypothetical protein